MPNPKITHSKTTEVEFVGRKLRYSWRTGFNDRQVGVTIEPVGRYRPHSDHLTIPTSEGGPEHWIESFIAELRQMQSAIISSRKVQE